MSFNSKVKNEVWFFGLDKKFDLFSYREDIPEPIHAKIGNHFQIKQISTGYFSTIFLFEDGRAIEYINTKDDYRRPESEVVKIENLKKVTSSYEIEAILTYEGKALAKGNNINPKKLHLFLNLSSLIEDKNDRIIEDIVCGRDSIYLLTSNQNAYGFGSNKYGQLNFDYKALEKAEEPILMMKNVSKIFSGGNSSSVFLLNSNQELFGCGRNDYGILGLGELRREEKEIDKLTKIQNIPKGKIIDIQSGFVHSIMLIEITEGNQNPKRKVYSTGDTEYNGLDKDGHTYEFTEIKSPLFENDNIVEIAVGGHQTLIITSLGKLIGFGHNDNGELGTTKKYSYPKPTLIQIPVRYRDTFNYHVSCGYRRSIYYYSPSFPNLEEDLIKLFRRKEFCDISFKTKNGEIIKAHKLILRFRLKRDELIDEIQEIISNKSIKESNQIFEMIYSNRIINPQLYFEIQELLQDKMINETMNRVYLNENEKDFIIERKEKQYKFPKLILIMRSELYRGMFLSVTNDTSNKVTDYSELSEESFEIFEYWIYSNQIKEGIEITKKIIKEIETKIDYFQLNRTNPNLLDLLINKFNQEKEKKKSQKKKEKCLIF
ncbi:claret isoform a [Anaeramoeba ignava]|uniref:Claret isoform a n=1 Tax=Anaeramoeba ignava TaxID=1746090 RepID=A0A9Q0LK43_ANAIG|nr:claret isoform a [Anaeramoeba ignava]